MIPVSSSTEKLRRHEQIVVRSSRPISIESRFAHLNRLGVVGELATSLSHEITESTASASNNARAALNFLDKQPPDLGEVREALACVVADVDRVGHIVDRIREHIKKIDAKGAL
jgi:phosphoglycerate-specific signal transduction histidine kinase